MDVDGVYAHVQSIFRSGLVTVIGSGSSAALGLPGMRELAEHLIANVPTSATTLGPESAQAWTTIEGRLMDGLDLEKAMTGVLLPRRLSDLIAQEVALCLDETEQQVLSKIITDADECALGRLLEYIIRTNPIADVITTNYDRVIEAAAVRSNIRVDTMFYGHLVGKLDSRLSREELSKPMIKTSARTTIRIPIRDHVRLSKPHGSLDWYEVNGEPVRSQFPLPGVRRIVVPGDTKLRAGYDVPFDAHRERGTKAIDRASAFLAIGFGFNDEHLQTHLLPRFPSVPSLVLARTLTESAREYVLGSDGRSVGLEASRVSTGGTHVVSTADDFEVPGVDLWDLRILTAEVLAL